MAEERLPKIALKWMPKQKRARRRPKKNWMEGIKKAMNERNLNEGQWEDRKQWSLGVGQRRRTFWTRYIHTYSDVPTTCFGRFLTGHHQVGIQCQRNYIPTISIDISVSVSTLLLMSILTVRCVTSRTVPGSIPVGVTEDFFRGTPDRTMCPERSTQPQKVSTRDFSSGKGGRCFWLTTYHPCSAETSR